MIIKYFYKQIKIALTKAQEINKKKVESLEKEIKDQKSVNTEKIEVYISIIIF